MPDHIHCFVRVDGAIRLGLWVRGLKRALSAAMNSSGRDGYPGRIWQPGFFDHVLRNSDSYGEKWRYVRDNPVRAGLVRGWDEWPYQGEIVRIDRV